MRAASWEARSLWRTRESDWGCGGRCLTSLLMPCHLLWHSKAGKAADNGSPRNSGNKANWTRRYSRTNISNSTPKAEPFLIYSPVQSPCANAHDGKQMNSILLFITFFENKKQRNTVNLALPCRYRATRQECASEFYIVLCIHSLATRFSIKLLPSKGDLLRWESDIAKTEGRGKRKRTLPRNPQRRLISAEADVCFSHWNKQCILQSEPLERK